jgi:glycine/D-amino acid oxidase-like deaminating enzyme
VAPWVVGAPKKAAYPAVAERLEASIAIIGGGLTGTATAYACAAAGLRVALLEADRIGRGASASGVGLILQAPPVSFLDMQALHGRRAARYIWTTWRRAALDLAATVRRLNVRTGLTAADALLWAQTADAARPLERELAARRTAGLEGTWLTGRALGRIGLDGAGGIRTRGDATVDPVRLTRAVARAAAARGATLFERTRALTVSPADGRLVIETARGSVRCDTVIIATGEPTGLFEPLARHAAACEGYAVRTPPLPAVVRAALRDRSLIFHDCERPPHRLAWTTGDRILWTGADQPRMPERLRQQTLVQRTGQLMYELSLVLPDISGIQPEYGWDVPYSIGRDGLPLIGPHRNYPRHLFALGLGTNPAAAFLASRLLLRHVAAAVDKGDEAFGFGRLPR